MLMRCMMILLLLMISVMPVWAGANTISPTEVTAEQMTMEDALSKVTIKAEDWLDGDMYYTRYTFTNPTDVRINKNIACTIVRYDLHYPASDSIVSTRQYNEDLSQLAIPPHSTCTATISMKHPTDVIFNDLKYSNFYFDDGSYLHYAENPKMISDSTKALFAISPIISPDNNVAFSVKNNSSSEIITEARNISLHFYQNGQSTHVLHADPIQLNINPGQTQIIESFSSKATVTKIGTISDPFYPYSGPFYSMSMRINGIPHTYIEVFAPDDFTKSYSKEVFVSPFNTQYQPSQKPLPKDGTFYLDDSYLYAYFPVTNGSNKTIAAPSVQYQLFVDYLDQDSRFQLACYRIRLPQDFCLASNETKYFSFKVPLPTDFHRMLPNIYPLRFLENHPELQSLTLFSMEKLPLPVSKTQYITLNDIKTQQSTSWQKYFNHLF